MKLNQNCCLSIGSEFSQTSHPPSARLLLSLFSFFQYDIVTSHFFLNQIVISYIRASDQGVQGSHSFQTWCMANGERSQAALEEHAQTLANEAGMMGTYQTKSVYRYMCPQSIIRLTKHFRITLSDGARSNQSLSLAGQQSILSNASACSKAINEKKMIFKV